jgi:hypothetical protein
MTPVTNRTPARGAASDSWRSLRAAHGLSDHDDGATADDEIGMIWWNRLSERERAEWSRAAGNTGVAADAWAAFRAKPESPPNLSGIETPPYPRRLPPPLGG